LKTWLPEKAHVQPIE